MSTNRADLGPDNVAGWEQEIRALEKEGCRAFVARDFDSLHRLWSDQLVVNSPLNRILPKEQVLGLLRSGRIQHSSYEQHIEQMWRHGDVVIVMGRETVVDPPGDQMVERRFTDIWRNEGGAWQMIGRHANIIR